MNYHLFCVRFFSHLNGSFGLGRSLFLAWSTWRMAGARPQSRFLHLNSPQWSNTWRNGHIRALYLYIGIDLTPVYPWYRARASVDVFITIKGMPWVDWSVLSTPQLKKPSMFYLRHLDISVQGKLGLFVCLSCLFSRLFSLSVSLFARRLFPILALYYMQSNNYLKVERTCCPLWKHSEIEGH